MRDTEFGDRGYRYRSHFRKKMIFIPFLVIGGLALVSYIVMLLWRTQYCFCHWKTMNVLATSSHPLGSVSCWAKSWASANGSAGKRRRLDLGLGSDLVFAVAIID